MSAHAKYNLSLQEAIVVLREQSLRNRTQTESGVLTTQLEGMSVDQAYDVGYATMLHDLESLTGPDPFEVHAVAVAPDGEFIDMGRVPEPMPTEEKN